MNADLKQYHGYGVSHWYEHSRRHQHIYGQFEAKSDFKE